MLYRKVFGFLLICLCLSQCGFKPLLSEENGDIVQAFSEIDIPVIPNRDGQIMRNELKKMFYVKGASAVKRYKLKVTTSSSDRNLSYLGDQTAGRKSVTVTANYQLIDLRSNEVLTSGTVSRQGFYTVSTSNSFGTIISAERVKMDAVLMAARDLRIQIATYLSKHPEALFSSDNV
ncbi:MAG: hypothetical protein CMM87_00870 [Rickettsiales bacterium]|nr:hypothetical protein [Rickettsiales bacterium]